ncbi:hypothetical protein AHAS_Ahas19G0049900 [Arachis hypogaea]
MGDPSGLVSPVGGALSYGQVVDEETSGSAGQRVVEASAIGKGHDAVVEGELNAALGPEIDATTGAGNRMGTMLGWGLVECMYWTKVKEVGLLKGQWKVVEVLDQSRMTVSKRTGTTTLSA